jgi:hypothetical protein
MRDTEVGDREDAVSVENIAKHERKGQPVKEIKQI